jgi:hypothetical protein
LKHPFYFLSFPFHPELSAFYLLSRSPLFNRVFSSHLLPSFVVFLFSVLCEIASYRVFHI